MMPVRDRRFRDAMKEVPTCVSIVLTSSRGSVSGCTISSLVSVDVNEESPTILFVLKKHSRVGALIKESTPFSVNVLADEMKELAELYSSERESHPETAMPSFLTMRGAVPIILGAPINFICEIDRVVSNYASDIYVSHVLEFSYLDSSSPLVYQNREFRRVGSRL